MRINFPVGSRILEIYAEDQSELAYSYRCLFGWQVDQAPGIDYWRIQTGATAPEYRRRIDAPRYARSQLWGPLLQRAVDRRSPLHKRNSLEV